MDSNELKELIQFISNSNFIEFEMEQEGFKLKLVKAAARANASADGRAGQTGQGGTAELASIPVVEGASLAPVPPPPPENLHDVISPIVGTFYRSPSPDTPPYVDVGDRVKKGQVLCIVEAMKLMNEIESEVAGEIAEIIPATGQPVEYGEVLFRLRPLG